MRNRGAGHLMDLWVALVLSVLHQRARKMDRQVTRLTYTLSPDCMWVTE